MRLIMTECGIWKVYAEIWFGFLITDAVIAEIDQSANFDDR